MPASNFTCRSFCAAMLSGVVALQGQEEAPIANPLWAPVRELEWSGSPGGLDKPWEAPSNPFNTTQPKPRPKAEDTALLVTPAEALLQGRPPGEAYIEAERLSRMGTGSDAGESRIKDAFGHWHPNRFRNHNISRACKLFKAIQQEYPEWQSELIRERIKEVEERMEREAGEGKSPKPPEAKAPAQLYLEGHLAMKAGNELEAQGDFSGAYLKLREASDLFEAAYAADRDWQPEIVEYRRRKIKEDMERVHGLESGSHPDRAKPLPEPEARAPAIPQEGKRTGAPDGLPELNHLRQKLEQSRRALQQAEQALQQARRREAALRTVLRDLLEESGAPRRELHPDLKPGSSGRRKH